MAYSDKYSDEFKQSLDDVNHNNICNNSKVI